MLLIDAIDSFSSHMAWSIIYSKVYQQTMNMQKIILSQKMSKQQKHNQKEISEI